MLLSFSGVDCSGKSTHIQYLENYFISIGKTCTVFQFEAGNSKEMRFARSAAKRALYLPKTVTQFVRAHLLRQPALAAPDTASTPSTFQDMKNISTELLDAALQWSLKLRLLERRYDVVICDRYIEDVNIDLMFKYPNYRFTDSFVRHITPIMPKPDHSFLLWLPLETMLDRLSLKDSSASNALRDNREKRYRAYDMLTGDIIRIDTSVSVEEAHQEIMRHILKKE